MHYTMVEPSCSNFRVITSIFSGVRNFRIFTVVPGSIVFAQTCLSGFSNCHNEKVSYLMRVVYESPKAYFQPSPWQVSFTSSAPSLG